MPVPAPRVVLDALDSVEVTHRGGLAERLPADASSSRRSRRCNTIFLIAAGQSTSIGTPPLRVIIVVTLNGTPQALIDGVMTNDEVQAGSGGSPGTLTVTGEDLTQVMDMHRLQRPAVPGHAARGARGADRAPSTRCSASSRWSIPMLFPDVPIPIDRIPAQQGTDLAYIRQLADEVGYVFYIEPGPACRARASPTWGPEIKVGVPQPALNVDMDAHTNVESLSFSFDTDQGRAAGRLHPERS